MKKIFPQANVAAADLTPPTKPLRQVSNMRGPSLTPSLTQGQLPQTTQQSPESAGGANHTRGSYVIPPCFL